MRKYSLVLLTAAVLFSGCTEDKCCGTGKAPTAVIAGVEGETITAETFVLSSTGSQDNNADGTIVDRQWTVDGTEVEEGYTLPIGEHNVCLLVTDNDGLTDQTCKTITITQAPNAAPVASITAPASCNANDPVAISGAGTDSDGTIASYTWTPSSIGTRASGEITCPASGTQQVCLTVTDNEGKASSEVCKTITVTEPEFKKPTAVITPSACVSGDAARKYSCADSHDNDTGNTDEKIVKCDWTILVYNADGSLLADHGTTYTTFFADGTIDGANSTTDAPHDPKWVGHEAGYKVITLVVTDNEGVESDPLVKKFDYTIGECGDLVDP